MSKTPKPPPQPPRLEVREIRNIGPELIIETDRGPLHVRGHDLANLLDIAAHAKAQA